MNNNDNKVGYKKPPVENQFKKGQSGNPNGRPKGTKNLRTDLEEELTEMVTLKEGGREMKMTKQRVLVKRLLEGGLKGEIRSLNSFLNLYLRVFGPGEEELDNNKELSAEDEAIIKAMLERKLAEMGNGGCVDA